MRVLIADDNPDDRWMAIRELEKEFGKIDAVEILSYDDLKKALQKPDFDVVITDYRLRWGTGFDVLKEVRRVSKYTPVIMLTLTGDESIAVEAMKQGFDDYALKSKKHIIKLPIIVKHAIENKRREKERDEALEKLKRSERKYRDLWDNANDFLFVISEDGTFVDVNRTALESLGYSQQDIGRLKVEDVVDEEFIDVVRERIRRIFEKAETLEPVELKLRTRDGRKIWVEIRSRPIIKDGEVKAIQGIARDITKRKEYEQLLKIVNDVNELMVREREIDDLLKGASEKLAERYPNFIAVAVDDRMKFYSSTGDFEDSECMKKAIESGETVVLTPYSHIEGCRYIKLHGHLYALAIPMTLDEEVKGVVVLHSESEFSDEEVKLLTTLASDLAFAVNAREIEEDRWVAYEQIERNIEQFAILVDQIRNPLAAISLLAEMVDGEAGKKILEQVKRIEELVSRLDKGWVESETVRNFLRRSWEKQG